MEALHEKELALEKKHLFLQTTMQLLGRISANDTDFKLRPSCEIRPLLSDLFRHNIEHRRTASAFVTRFTDSEPILHFCFLISGH